MGYTPQLIPYPRSNIRLVEYRVKIQAIRDTQAEFDRLGTIDPHPYYEIVFNRWEQVKVGREITDSNHIAEIAIGTPGEHDQIELINANGDVIKQILQEERCHTWFLDDKTFHDIRYILKECVY